MSKPECKLIGENGNVFNLLNKAKAVLDRETGKEMTERVLNEARCYEDSLNIIGEYVEIV